MGRRGAARRARRRVRRGRQLRRWARVRARSRRRRGPRAGARRALRRDLHDEPRTVRAAAFAGRPLRCAREAVQKAGDAGKPHGITARDSKKESVNVATETPTRDAKIVQYLNEAYGKEKQLETSLQAHIGMTTRAPYKKRLQQHLKETKAHARSVERRIKQLGGKAESGSAPGPVGDVTSGMQSVASKAVAAAKGPLHAIRGTGESEKMLKNAKTEYHNEFEEIATYTGIEALADAVNDKETAKVARGIRREEERMAKFLEKQIPQLAKAVAKEEIPAAERRNGSSRSSSRRSSSTRARRASNGSSRSSSGSRSTASRASSSGSKSATSRSGSKSGSSRSSSSRSGSPRSSSSRAGSSAKRSGSASSRSGSTGASGAKRSSSGSSRSRTSSRSRSK